MAAEHSYLVQSEQSQVTVAQQRALLKNTQSIPKISGELAGEGHFLGSYHFGQEWALVQADWSLGDFLKKTGWAARQDVLTRQFRMQQKQLEAMGNAAVLYVAILQTQKAGELIEARLKLMQKHKLLAESMWKAGLRTQLDVLQTETQITQLQEDSIRLRMNEINLRRTLARRLGFRNGDSLRLISFSSGSFRKIYLPETGRQDIHGNLKIRILQSEIAAWKLRTDAVQAKRFPHVMLGGGWFADGDPKGDGNYWLINGGIRIPIYEGKAVKRQESAFLAQKESLDYQLQNVQRETLIKTNRLLEKMKQLRHMIQIQQTRINTLKESSQFAEVNFKAGLITNLEYLDIQQKLTDARLKLEQSRLGFAMNLIDYYVITNQTERLARLGK